MAKRTLNVASGALVAGAAVFLSVAIPAAEVSRSPFGALPDARLVEAVTLRNGRGVTATVINYGAALQALTMPDRAGQSADVVLGYASLEGYLAKPEYFGGTVGRVANRIAKGRFVLDGKTYQTPQNNMGNALHGGLRGFDKVLWQVIEVRRGPTASVVMRYVSPNGDQGYPGALTVLAKYSLDEANALTIEYTATTNRPTVVNVSNHTYWNLSGEGSDRGAMGHVLTIWADTYTPVDDTLIPTGEFRPVGGTVFDFRKPTVIGARVRDGRERQIVIGRGYDHNFVIAHELSPAPRLQARVEDPASGRGFELWSNQPGLQFYSGNFLDGTVIGKSQHAYREGDALVLEPQLFPDTPNRPAFGSARIEPGSTYRNVIIYRLTTGQHVGKS
jgi:aldose 1-epimerase